VLTSPDRDLPAVPISLPPLRRIPLAPFAALACLVVLAVAVSVLLARFAWKAVVR
jgi:hypothetical protein